ncbi:mannose-6-phosphate isomerase, class I [Pseudalkalibacillus hwajinpoensis]|uniref:mannose-6-phosphate isomerase, class I n=1 Tax=Guptibacillus hwajinpoensis TaxID=208199 RepID=UPI00325BC12E
MMYQHEPLFLNPEFKDRLWGGTKLRDVFGYSIPTETTGECWGISAHQNGPSEVRNGPLAGKKLNEVWQSNRELFNDEAGDHFPLLVKILDADRDLSVQVHPDDTYAREIEGEAYGKTECWYIIDCDPGSELIFGHHAKSKESFEQMIADGEWDSLLRRVPIEPGELYFVPSGTIHAIGAGTMILETQQSSDTTYRVYDYNRTDGNGNTRELHIERSIDVSTIPHVDPGFHPVVKENDGLKQIQLVESEYFTVYRWEVDGEYNSTVDHSYLLVSVLSGEGHISSGEASFSVNQGDHFIIPSTMKEFKLEGDLEMIVSKSNKA